MRKAFSMVTATFIIVIMSTISILVFNLSGKMVKSTTLQYRHTQAAFLARSYTELAILSVINHERNTTSGCIQTISGVVNGLVPGGAIGGSSTAGSGYDIKTYIYYIGNNLPCNDTYWLNHKTVSTYLPLVTDYNDKTPSLADSIAAIVVDVYVRYKDPAMVDAYKSLHSNTPPTATQIPWITYHRRSLQKI